MKEILSPKQKQWILGGFVGALGIAVIVIIALIAFGVIWKNDTNSTVESTSKQTEQQKINEEESCDETHTEITRTTSLNHILDHINSIAPKKPKPGNRWVTQRLEFVNNDQAYAVYSDSESERRVLVEITKTCGKTEHHVLAYFEKNGESWELKEGDDIYNEPEEERLDIYEFYDPKKEWLPIETIRQLEEEKERAQQEHEDTEAQQDHINTETQQQEEEKIDENEEELTD